MMGNSLFYIFFGLKVIFGKIVFFFSAFSFQPLVLARSYPVLLISHCFVLAEKLENGEFPLPMQGHGSAKESEEKSGMETPFYTLFSVRFKPCMRGEAS